MKVLVQVFAEGRSLSSALPQALAEVPETRDRALAQDLCYGVMRWWPRLEAIAAGMMRKPLQRRDTDLHCLILTGLYQLLYSRVPPHAAVAETVNVAGRLGKPWARAVINAVLRRFQRERDAILARVDAREQHALAHPLWLLELIRRDWPEDWPTIIDAANQRPPMWLRVNLRQGPRADYLLELDRAGITARDTPHCEAAVLIETPVDVARLPGFAEGRVSVQDAAAQLAATLLDPSPGDRVLDLCAAPGGKTAHILEIQPRIAELVAVEVDSQRLDRVRENLSRLGVIHSPDAPSAADGKPAVPEVRLLHADAADPEAWWNGRPFDRILLDAPCSALGVVRRHPDIKRLRRPDDIEALVLLQQRLLDAAWTMLADGGMLLYATCSIIHSENDEQIRRFLDRHADARERRIEAGCGRVPPCGWQILPGECEMDGFFYARIHKVTKATGGAG